jgi:hypothetical protein
MHIRTEREHDPRWRYARSALNSHSSIDPHARTELDGPDARSRALVACQSAGDLFAVCQQN